MLAVMITVRQSQQCLTTENVVLASLLFGAMFSFMLMSVYNIAGH